MYVTRVENQSISRAPFGHASSKFTPVERTICQRDSDELHRMHRNQWFLLPHSEVPRSIPSRLAQVSLALNPEAIKEHKVLANNPESDSPLLPGSNSSPCS
jgi:hypothetical protein